MIIGKILLEITKMYMGKKSIHF